MADFFDTNKPKEEDFFDKFHPSKVSTAPPGPFKPDANKIIQPVSRNPLEPQIVQQQLNEGKKLPITQNTDAYIKSSQESLPMVGGMTAGIPGAALGSVLKNLIGNITKGQIPNPIDTTLDIGKDTLLQGVVPKVVGNILSRSPRENAASILSSKPIASNSPTIQNAVKEQGAKNVTEGVSKLLNNEGDIVKGMASNIGEAPPLKLKSNKFTPPTTIQNDLYKAANGEIPLSKISDRAFSNIDELRQLKTLDPGGTEKLGLSRIFKNGAKVNPDKILDELNGTNSSLYKEALTGETYKNVTDLISAAKASESAGTGIEKALSFGKGKFLLSLPLLATVPYVGLGAASKTLGGVVLTESAISKLMQDPQLAKLTLQAIKTPLGSPESTLLSKAITYGLRGATVIVKGEDGKDEKATFGPKGELQYVK